MLNKQTPSKSSVGSLDLLLHSIFYTLQGEGPFAGEAAVFVRFAGCNLQCPMCDTEYTQGAKYVTPDWLAMEVYEVWSRAVVNTAHPLVVITGGEPFRQPIGPFVRQLLKLGFRVQIETNGTLYQEAFPYGQHRLTIVCSPKAGKVNRHLEPHINAYKYVLSSDDVDPKDGLPNHALGLPGKVARPATKAVPIYVNPMDEQDVLKNHANLIATAESCLLYGYRFGVQLHKLAGVA